MPMLTMSTPGIILLVLALVALAVIAVKQGS